MRIHSDFFSIYPGILTKLLRVNIVLPEVALNEDLCTVPFNVKRELVAGFTALEHIFLFSSIMVH